MNLITELIPVLLIFTVAITGFIIIPYVVVDVIRNKTEVAKSHGVKE